MIVVSDTIDDLKEKIKSFIWEFKIQDNIFYNLDVLFNLVDDFNNQQRNYEKPISIISISIVEVIMIDFLYRLYISNKHFPESLKLKKDDIKNFLKNETINSKVIGSDGKEVYCSTLKNINFSTMVEIYQKLKLLGCSEVPYKVLLNLSYFRNRVHIKNYFNNFEKDEGNTFSERRAQRSILIMIGIIDYFKNNFWRPWENGNNNI